MMDVKPYEYRDLSKTKASNSGVKPFKEPTFQVQPEQIVTKIADKRTDAHFKLDKTVESQLGIEEKERKAFEDRVHKEIERRWEVASEQAEVQGFERGLEEGRKEAYNAEIPRIKAYLDQLEHFLHETDTMREKIFLANESFLMDIIAQVSKMILLKEVEQDKEYLHRLVISLVNQLGTKDDVKISISQEDAENIEALKAAISKEFGKLNFTTIDVNPQIPVGGCKVETRFGVMDASIETQIQNLMRALRP